jgi:hypothetical protein
MFAAMMTRATRNKMKMAVVGSIPQQMGLPIFFTPLLFLPLLTPAGLSPAAGAETGAAASHPRMALGLRAAEGWLP